MLKAKPTVLANVNHDTRHVRDSLPQGEEFIEALKPDQFSIPCPVRVLLIAPSLDIIGGQSVQAQQLLSRLENEPAVHIRFLPINPRLPAFLRAKYIRTLITTMLYFGRLMACIGRADVLHIFTPGYFSFYLAAAPALLLATALRKPTILNYHDGRAQDHLERWPLARRLLRLASVIVAPSDYLVAIFSGFGLPARRIFNVAARLALAGCRRPRVGTVFLHNRGLAPEYNPACTLRAFAIVQERFPAARLIVAHDGPLRSQLQALAAKLRLRHTQFVGSVSAQQMAGLYAMADIYLMSPNADNMPLSVLECFAAGLPVVSSNAGGIPNLVEDQVTGLLFAADDHQAMAACALRLLEEPGLAMRLAANGRARCDKYRWSEIGPQWIALYQELLEASINSV
jgi:glycosyltransferase involved in cell wall biosynthesis